MGTPQCPMATTAPASAPGAQLDAVNRHGDEVMGFGHASTRHHFTLLSDGGEIRVQATSTGDSTSVAQIRNHLQAVATAFSSGDFTMPVQIHGRLPDGAVEMQRLRQSIVYHYEPVEQGGRVLVMTRDAEALEAIHAFLRFQILDHQTGDPVRVGS
jgi:hypothetical protein